MSVTWDDVKNLEADLREQAALQAEETAAQAYARMTEQERKADRAFERARRQADRAEWAARYPLHCRCCAGWGRENVLVGDEDCCEVETDTCSHCLNRHRCPRCGCPFEIFTETTCSGCGWKPNDEQRGMPAELLDYGASDLNDFTDPFAEAGDEG